LDEAEKELKKMEAILTNELSPDLLNSIEILNFTSDTIRRELLYPLGKFEYGKAHLLFQRCSIDIDRGMNITEKRLRSISIHFILAYEYLVRFSRRSRSVQNVTDLIFKFLTILNKEGRETFTTFIEEILSTHKLDDTKMLQYIEDHMLAIQD